MKKLLITVLLLIFCGCTDYSEIITIGEDESTFVKGMDGFIADFMLSFSDVEIIDSTEDGMIFINGISDTSDFFKSSSTSHKSSLFRIDTVGDTIIYRRSIMLWVVDSASKELLDTTIILDSLYTDEKIPKELKVKGLDPSSALRFSWLFLGNTHGVTIKTKDPIVWTNGDLISTNQAELYHTVTPIVPKEKELIVKCIYRGELDSSDQQLLLAKAKVKGFFNSLWDKIKNWFSRTEDRDEETGGSESE